MRVRMFKPQFRNLVISGEKRQTIGRIQSDYPSSEIWNHNGLDRHIVPSNASWPRSLYRMFSASRSRADRMELDGKDLSSLAQSKIAKADGFNYLQDMLEWFKFTHGLPFNGILILARICANGAQRRCWGGGVRLVWRIGMEAVSAKPPTSPSSD